MSTEVCLECGASYSGWQCPNCYATDKQREATEAASQQLADTLSRNAERLAEEQEVTRRTYEESAFRMEVATARASQQHRDTIANSWKLEAEAKADRAYELYRAHLHSEASALAREALQQDPGNLSAYKTAAWSLEAQGNTDEARGYYEKQIDILRTPDYRSSASSFASVVAGLPEDEFLLNRARRVFHDLLESWSLRNDTNNLLKQICKRKWSTEVSQLTQRLNRSDDNLVPHLAILSGAGYQMEAYDLARTLARTKPSIAHHAWSIELGSAGQRDVGALDEWLASVPANSRAVIAKQVTDVRKAGFTEATVTVLGQAIGRRRQAWQSDIAKELSIQATRESLSDSEMQRHISTQPFIARPVPAGCLTFSFLGIGLFGLFAFYTGGDCSFIVMMPYILILVALVSAGLWYFLKERTAKEVYKKMYEPTYEKKWRQEEAFWQEALMS